MMNGNSVAFEISDKTAKREAYFLDFATEIRKRHPQLLIMLTGGFRTRSGMNSAIESNACDLIGVGRPSAITPDFPRSIIGINNEGNIDDAPAGMQLAKVQEPRYLSWLPQPQLRRALRGGLQTRFYSSEIQKLVQ
jgi:2,4-dienoyl-CoA reductase-like NADH-dependent reductase (Old Yellow Enzyme family)